MKGEKIVWTMLVSLLTVLVLATAGVVSSDVSDADDPVRDGTINESYQVGKWEVNNANELIITFEADHRTEAITSIDGMEQALADVVTRVIVNGYLGDIKTDSTFKSFGLDAKPVAYTMGYANLVGYQTDNLGTWQVSDGVMSVTAFSESETRAPNDYVHLASPIIETVSLVTVTNFNSDITSRLNEILPTIPVYYVAGSGDVKNSGGEVMGSWSLSANTLALTALVGHDADIPDLYVKMFGQTNQSVEKIVVKGFSVNLSVLSTQFPNANQIVYLGGIIKNHSGVTVGNWGIEDSRLTIETVQEYVGGVWKDTYYDENDLTFAGMEGDTKNSVYSINVSRFRGDLDEIFAMFPFASSITYTDTVPTNGFWTYNYKTKEMVISSNPGLANPALKNFTVSGQDVAPWALYPKIKAEMKTMRITGYTSVGNYFMFGCTAVESFYSDSILSLVNRYAFRITCSEGIASTNEDLGSLSRIEMPNLVTLGNATDTWYAAFWNHKALHEVVIPKVTTVGAGSFYGCTDLVSVTLGTSGDLSITIGNQAFDGCTNFTTVDTSRVIQVNSYAFRNCTSLVAVNLPIVREIKDYAFRDCIELTTADTRSNTVLKSVGTYAFYGDVKLEYFNLPNTMQTIGTYAFYNCQKMTDVNLGPLLKTIPSYAFYNCKGLENVTIPNDVTSVGTYAYYGCSNIETLVFGTGVTEIGASAFYGLSKLIELRLPDVLESIGSSAFNSCTALKGSTYIDPEGETKWHLVIPDSVTIIGSSAFQSCTSLPGLYLGDPDNSVLETISSNAFYYDTAISGSIVIPNSVTLIDTNAFRELSNITSLTLGSNLNKIGNLAFYSCTGIDGTIEIPNSLQIIGAQAFQACAGIDLLILGEENHLNSLGNQAFQSCTQMAGEIFIPGDVATIGTNAFYNTKLTKVTLNEGTTTINDGAFAYCGVLETCDIPQSVTFLGNTAFGYCYKLEMVLSFSDGLTNIGNSAFYGDTLLEGTVTIGPRVSKIGSSAFRGCTGITGVDFSKCTALTEIGETAFRDCSNMTGDVILPDTVTSIGASAFYNCERITGMKIGKLATIVGNNETVFYKCRSLSYVDVDDDNPSLTDLDGVAILDSAKQTLYVYAAKSDNTTFTVPATVTKICDYAFYTASNLQDLTFSSAASFTIGTYAFAGLYNSTDMSQSIPCGLRGSLVIPATCSSIGASAFRYCPYLTEVTILGTSTTHGSQEFEYCSGLKTLTAPINMEFLQKFNGCINLTTFNFTGVSGNNSYYTVNSNYTPWHYYNSNVATGGATLNFATSIVEIPKNMFYNATRVGIVNMLPDGDVASGITTIRENAFYGCTGIKTLVIGNQVTNIENNAFYNCYNISDLTLPISIRVPYINHTITTINKLTFTPGLTGISVDYRSESVASSESVAYAMWYASSKYTLTISEGIVSIGDNMHLLARGDVTMPSSMRSIGDYAFRGATLYPLNLNEGLEEIGDSAFAGCTQLQDVAIPSSVSYFGEDPFANCNLLGSVSLPITLPMYNMFTGCPQLKKFVFNEGINGIGVDYDSETCLETPWYLNKNHAYDVSFLSGVKYIGTHMFDGCANIGYTVTGLSGSVVLPDSIEAIGEYAFKGCAMSTLTFGMGLTLIGTNAFENCSKITALELTSDVTYSAGAFKGCSGVQTLTLPADLNPIVNFNSPLFEGSTGIKALHFTGSGNSLNYVDNTESDLGYMYTPWYYSTSNAISFDFAPGIKTVGEYMFKDCKGLTGKLTLSGNLLDIGDHAFEGCTRLNEIDITTSDVTLGTSAFAGLTGLSTLTVPADLDVIQDAEHPLFEGCTSLNTLHLTGRDCVDYTDVSGSAYYYGLTPWNQSRARLTTIDLADSLIYLGDNLFNGCSAINGDIVLPASLTMIGTSTFEGCSAMDGTVTVTPSIVEVGSHAFKGCISISKLVVENDECSFGYGAFNGCSGISNMTVPVGMDVIGTDPDDTLFAGCTGVVTLEITGESTSRDYNEDNYMYTPWHVSASRLKNLTLSPDITSIGAYMFKGCGLIAGEFVLSNNVESIGAHAFEDCVALTRITFGTGIEEVGEAAFKGCTKIGGAFTLPTSITDLGSQAFANTGIVNLTVNAWPSTTGNEVFGNSSKLTTLNLAVSLNAAYGVAFAGCTKVTTVKFIYVDDGTGATYSDNSGDVNYYQNTPWYISRANPISVTFPGETASVGSNVFKDCTGLSGTVTIPNQVSIIGAHAFDGCTKLSGLSLSTSLTTINDYAFNRCVALKGTLTIPASVMHIYSYAFNGCSAITRLSITEGVNDIGAHAFDGCSAMVIDLSMPTTVREVGEFAFNSCTSITGLTIQFAQVTLGAGAFNKCSGITRLSLPADMDIIVSNANPVFKDCVNVANLTLTGTLDGAKYSNEPTADNFYQLTPWYFSRSGTLALTLSDSIRSIGAYTFMGCLGIKSGITIPTSLVTVFPHAFDGCSGATSLTFNGVALTTIDDYAFNGCTNIGGTLALPAQLTYVNKFAFAGCSTLSGLVIPSSLGSIGESAFDGCTKISTDLALPNTVKELGDYAFRDCSAIKSLSIVNDTLAIGKGAFTRCVKIASLTMPANMNAVKYNSAPIFDGCTGISTLSLTGSSDCVSYNDDMSTEKGNYYQYTPWYASRANPMTVTLSKDIMSIGDYLFAGCSGISGALVIPSAAKTIGIHAFDGCIGVTGSYTLAETVSSVGDYAFQGCTGISGLVISNRNTAIGASAFAGCTGVRSLTVPIALNIVGDDKAPIFNGCIGLNTVTFTGTGVGFDYSEVPGEKNNCYTNTPWYFSRMQNISVSFPDGLTQIGTNMFRGCLGLVGTTGSDGTLAFPDSVTIISDSAFQGCNSISSLALGRSLNTIGNHAFDGCSGLIGEFVLTSNVNSLGEFAFQNCSKISTLTVSSVPATLGKGAFNGCAGIKTLSIPVSMNAAFSDAAKPGAAPVFGGCAGINKVVFTGSGESASYSEDSSSDNYYQYTPWYYSRGNNLTIEFPEGITTFGTNMFKGCTGYAGTLTVSSRVATIGAGAFEGCTHIGGITMLSDQLTTIGNNAFKDCSNISGTLTIPSSVSSIGSYAFANCSSLSGLSLPSNLNSIGDNAFQGCINLSIDLVIPTNMRILGQYAFAGCTALNSVTISNKYLSVGKAAFSGCSGIKTLSYPLALNTVVDADAPVFGGCSGINAVNLTATVTGDAGYDYSNQVGGDWYQLTPWFVSKANSIVITLSNEIGIIGAYTFMDSGLAGSITLPTSLSEVKAHAFDGCVNITGALTLGSNVTTIGAGAFANCTKLDSLVVTNQTTELSAGSFKNCTSLRAITVPGSMNTVKNNLDPVFGNCGNILVVTVFGSGASFDYTTEEPTVEGVSSYKNTPWYLCRQNTLTLNLSEGLTVIGNNAFRECVGIAGTLTIPSTVFKIGAGAFQGCVALNGTLALGDAVTDIGASAFQGCTGFTGMTMSANIAKIGASAFENCAIMASNLVLASSLTEVGAFAFKNCAAISSLVLSGAEATLGKGAFENCTGIKVLSVPATVNTVADADDYVFKGCNGIQAVTISGSGDGFDYSAEEGAAYYKLTPWQFSAGLTLTVSDTLRSIGDYTFADCAVIKGPVTLSTSMVEVGAHAFDGCSAVTSVTFSGTNLTTIGAYAFNGCSAVSGTLVIPSSVATIGDGAFAGCSSVSGLTMSGTSMTSIGAGAFENCAAIAGNVIIPESVTVIGARAFAGCPVFNNLVLGSGVTTIGESAFDGDSAIASTVTVNEALKTLGAHAFRGTGITSLVVLNPNVTVGKGAFADCVRLSTLTIPASINTVLYDDDPVFSGCTGVRSVTLSGATCFSYTDDTNPEGVIEGVSHYAYTPWSYSRTNAISVTIPTGMTSVGDYYFYGCSGLSSDIVLPDSVTVIGKYSFAGCPAFTNLTLGTGVTTIGDSAFDGDTALSSGITITSTLKTVGNHAFRGTGITSLDVKNASVTFGKGAFADCTRLEALTVPASVNTVVFDDDPVFSGCTGIASLSLTGASCFSYTDDGDSEGVVSGVSHYAYTPWSLSRTNEISLTLSSSLSSVGDYFFCGCSGITSDLDLPASVKSVGVHSFDGCSGMEGTITIGSGFNTVAEFAFQGCTGVSEVIITSPTAVIGKGAFQGCTGLTDLTLPVSYDAVGNYDAPVFASCTGLTSVTFTGSGVAISYENKTYPDYYTKTPWYASASSAIALTFSETQTSIGAHTFRGCTGVSGEISIPATVTTVGDYAFAGCSGATSVVMAGTAMTSIGAHAFENCASVSGTITIPVNVTSIGAFAFAGCSSFSGIALNENLVTINESAFDGATSLATAIVFPASVKTVGDHAFRNSAISALTLSSGSVSLGKGAFADCASLETLTVLASLNLVGYNSDPVFAGCTAVSTVTINGTSAFNYTDDSYDDAGERKIRDGNSHYEFLPWNESEADEVRVTFADTIQAVGDFTFRGCGNLSGSLVLPAAVTTIGKNAFDGCSKVSGVISLNNANTSVGDYAFRDCANLSKVVIGDTGVRLGKAAFGGCTGVKVLTLPLTYNAVQYNSEPVFDGCTGINSLSFTEFGNGVNYSDDAGSDSYYQLTPWYQSRTNNIALTLSAGTVQVGDHTFRGCSGISGTVTFPENVTTVGKYAFADCSGINTLELGAVKNINEHAFENVSSFNGSITISSISTLADYAFKGCVNITAVTVENVPSTLGVGVFDGCRGIKTLTVPITFDTVKSKDAPLFKDCAGLTSVVFTGEGSALGYSNTDGDSFYQYTPWYYSRNNTMSLTFSDAQTTIGAYTFKEITGLTGVLTMPSALTTIDTGAFDSCSRISGLDFSKSKLQVINASAFNGCSSITGSLVLPNTVTTIGADAFNGCNTIKGLVLSTGLTTIGARAFQGCISIAAAIELPVTVAVGEFAFSGCTSLSALTVSDKNQVIGKGAFTGCTGILSLTVPVALDVIVDYENPVFKDCSGITSLRLTGNDEGRNYSTNKDSSYYLLTPWQFSRNALTLTIDANVLSIGNYAFCGVTGLTGVSLPVNLTSIGREAFNGCSGMTGTIDTGAAVTSIGEKAFAGCSNITSIVIESPLTVLSAGAFSGCASVRSISVPGNQNMVVSYTDPAFAGCTSVTSVTITGQGKGWDYTDTLSSISYYKFTPWYLSRSNTMTLSIEDGVTSVGDYMFCECGGITGSLTVPASVTSIGTKAFKDCVEINGGLVLGSFVTSVMASAFEGCTKVSAVSVASSAMEFGKSVFRNCSGLTSITLPLSVNTVVDPKMPVFEGCVTISKVTLNGALDGHNYSDSETSESFYAKTPWFMTSVNVALTLEDVFSIGDFTFMRCIHLAGTVTLPESLQAIGEHAFDGCNAISGTLTIPAAVNTIGASAFENCTSVAALVIAGNPANVSGSVFKGDTGLKTITMPISFNAVGSKATPTFEGCYGVSNMIFTAGSGFNYGYYGDAIEFGENDYRLTPWYLSRAHDISVTFQDGVASIGNYMFHKCGTSLIERGVKGVISLPESVKSIGTSAFEGCYNITGVSAPGVVTVSSAVFSDCAQLSGVNLPALTLVSSKMFYRCVALASATLTACTSIGSSAFEGTTALKNVNSVNSEARLVSFPDVTTVSDRAFALSGVINVSLGQEGRQFSQFGDFVFLECPTIETVALKSTMSMLPENTFKSGMTSPDFRSTIKRIDASGVQNYSANTSDNFPALQYLDIRNATSVSGGNLEGIFRNCTALETVVLYKDESAGAIYSLPKNAFRGCTSLVTIDLYNAQLANGYEFYGCTSLMAVNLAKSNIVPDYAFYGCSKLSSVSAPNATTIGSYAFARTNMSMVGAEDFSGAIRVNEYAFSDCLNLSTVELPNVTNVGVYTFKGCAGLSKVTLDKILTIESGTFYDCTSLTTVSLAAAEAINPLAFSGCRALTALALPSMKTVGVKLTSEVTLYDYNTYGVFLGCNTLNRVTMPELETVGAFAFYGCGALTSLNGTNVINLDVKYIGVYAFTNSGVTNVVVGAAENGLSEVGDYAFYGCSSMQTFSSPSLLTLPEHLFSNAISGEVQPMRMLRSISVDSVNSFNVCLRGSTSLIEVHAPSARTFADYAFYGCTSLQTVELMDNTAFKAVVTLSAHMFEGCTSLTSVTLTNAQFGGSTTDSTNGSTFKGCTRLSSVDIPSATVVAASAFEGCSALTTAKIPSATDVGASAFKDCVSLVRVDATAAATLRDAAFQSCGALVEFNTGTGHNPFMNVETIGKNTFDSCPFTTVVLGPRTTSIGQYAFRNNTSLKELVTNNRLDFIAPYAFSGCALESVHIASSVTSIGAHAFEYSGYAVPVKASFWFNGDVGPRLLDTTSTITGPLTVDLHVTAASVTNMNNLISQGAVTVSAVSVIPEDSTYLRFQADQYYTATYSQINVIYGGKIVLPYGENPSGGTFMVFGNEMRDETLLAVYASDADFELDRLATSGDALGVYPLAGKDPSLVFDMSLTGEEYLREMTILTDAYGYEVDVTEQTVHFGSAVTIPSFTDSVLLIAAVTMTGIDGRTFDVDPAVKTIYAGYYFTGVTIMPEDAKVDVTFVSAANGNIPVVIKLQLKSLLLPLPASIQYLEAPADGFVFDGWYMGEGGTGTPARATTQVLAGMVWYAYFKPIEYHVEVSCDSPVYSVSQTLFGPYTLHLVGSALYYTDYSHLENVLLVDCETITGYDFTMFMDHGSNKRITGDYGPNSDDMLIDLYMTTKKYSITMEFVDEKTSEVIGPEYMFTISGWAASEKDTYRSGDVTSGIDYLLIEKGLVMPAPLNNDYSLAHMFAGDLEIIQVAGKYTVVVSYFDSDNSMTLTFRMSKGLVRVMFDIGDDAKSTLDFGSQLQAGDMVMMVAVTRNYTKIGYVYDYLYVEGLPDEHYSELQMVEITEEMVKTGVNCVVTFKVHWVSKVYTFNYDTNPYETTVEPTTGVRIGDKVTLPSVTGYTGYSLISWSFVAGSMLDALSGSFTLTKEMIEKYSPGSTDITLHANWSTKTYLLKVDESAGLKYINKSVKYGESFQFWDIGSYSKAYQKFEGWELSDGRVFLSLQTTTLDEGMAAIGDAGNDVITVYFSWIDLEYQVQYNLNKGSGQTPFTNEIFIVNQTLFKMAEKDDSFYRDGYIFIGWKYSADSYTVYVNESGYFDAVLAQAADSNNIVTLYAVWSEKAYKLSYDLAGGRAAKDTPTTATYGNVVTINNPTKAGYKFTGWTAENLTAGALYASAYGFSNWDGKKLVTMTSFLDLCSVNDGVVIMHAHWEEASFQVVFDTNGGTGTVVDPINEISIGERIAFPTLRNAYKLGYDFAGWSVDGVNPIPTGTVFDSSMVQSLDESEVVFYAVWSPIQYTLQYRYVDVYNYTTMTVSYSEEVTIPEFSRVGYVFSGWVAKNLADTAYYSNDAKTWYRWADGSTPALATYFRNLASTPDIVVLDAVWEPIQYRIVYNANGGTGVPPVDGNTYIIGDPVTLKDYSGLNGTYGNKTVVGWALTSTGTVINVTQFTEALAKSADATNSVTMYAVWVEGLCTVSIDLDGCTPSRIPAGWVEVTGKPGTYQKQYEYGTSMNDVMSDWQGITLSKGGYVFENWTYSSGVVTSDVKVEPVMEQINYSTIMIFGAVLAAIFAGVLILRRRGI